MEKELTKEERKLPEDDFEKGNICCEGCYKLGIEKGKLEQKKEELEFLKELIGDKYTEGEIDGNESPEIKIVLDRIKQLQKEIGGIEK